MWNELFPELVKIGITKGNSSTDVEKRRRELSCGENMPQPFEAKFAICVNNYEKIERIIHKGLTKLRHNPHREFFKLSVDEAINLLSGYIISGSAVEVPIKNSFKSDEKAAIKNMQKQRDSISFRSLNIPVGTTLTFANAKHLTVKTANDGRRIILPNGKTATLSIAAKRFHIPWQNPVGIVARKTTHQHRSIIKPPNWAVCFKRPYTMYNPHKTASRY